MMKRSFLYALPSPSVKRRIQRTHIGHHTTIPRSFQVEQVLHRLVGDRQGEGCTFSNVLQVEGIAVAVCLYQVPFKL